MAAVSPFANWGDFFLVEYRVNGLWNKLLQDNFSTGYGNNAFIISPEAYPHPDSTSGPRADLCVNRLIQGATDWRLGFSYLLFEGKGANGDNFDAIQKQLEKWFNAAASATNIKFESWAIAVRGKRVGFFHYQSNGNYFSAREIAKSGGKYKLVTHSGDGKYYDITVPADWAQVEPIIEWLSNNAP